MSRSTVNYDQVLHLWPRGMSALQAVAWGTLAYVVAHTLVRILFSDVIAVDWVGETVYAQTLDWGQTPKYPPLPAWVLWAVHQVTGPSVLSTLIVKYAVLWAAFVVYFLAARKVLANDGWAVLATLCVLLIFQVAWNAHEGVTHTIFLILAAPLTLLAVLRAADTGEHRWVAYVALGVAVAIGALSKQAYFAGLVALGLAMLLQPRFRAVVFDWRILIAGATCTMLAGPHYIWALSSGFDYGAAASATLGQPGVENVLAQVSAGLISSIQAPVLFLSPLLPVLLLTFPRAFGWGNLVHPGTHGVPGGDPVRLVRDTVLFGIVVLIVPVLVAGVAHYGERWMHPLMLLAPIYLVAMIRAMHPSPARLRLFVGIVFAVTALALGWRLAGFVNPSPLTCGKCRLEVPYAALAKGVAEMGFAGGTILAGDEHIAGNMRTHFPDARVVALNYDYYDPPENDALAGQCLVIWRPSAGQSTAVVPAAAFSYAGLSRLPDAAQARAFRLAHGHAFKPDDYQVSQFAAVLMPASGRCR
ncbi:glycosyltransferase family 39 protein [Pyruvatibacter sp.]|uniref:ArnT family glycosyltransferase n=1 Tax=Pyruvatibacter sp. TaxID=1981328 RepID=UPI0032EBB5BF